MKHLFLLLILSFNLLAVQGNSFVVSGAAEVTPGKADETLDNPEVQTKLIAQLKQKAVAEWLQNFLGARYQNFQKAVTPEFGEKYVLDYKVTRVPALPNTLELSGHLDSDALKKWARVSETKEKGQEGIRPVFIYSSLAGAMQSAPRETSEKIKDSSVAQLVFKELTTHFQKLNSKLVPFEGRLGLNAPSSSEDEIGTLSNEVGAGRFNAVVWAHLSQCANCSTARIDLYVYSLAPARLAVVKSEDLAVAASALTNAERAKKSLTPFLAQLHEGVEETISEGKLFSNDFTLRIEGIGGIDGYRTYKLIDKDFQRQDFLNQPSLKMLENTGVEFKVLSTLSSDELAQRIQTTTWAGFKLQRVSVDSHTIVMRYSK